MPLPIKFVLSVVIIFSTRDLRLTETLGRGETSLTMRNETVFNSMRQYTQGNRTYSWIYTTYHVSHRSSDNYASQRDFIVKYFSWWKRIPLDHRNIRIIERQIKKTSV